MKALKLWEISEVLKKCVLPWMCPKQDLEQYNTPSDIAAQMMFTAQNGFGDLKDKVVLDLGCGCGMLTASTLFYQPKSVTSVDIDMDSITQIQSNLVALYEEHSEFKSIPTDVIHSDVSQLHLSDDFESNSVDTTVTNPPFGTRVRGIDTVFLAQAVRASRIAVYSLHKTSTRPHIIKLAESWGCAAKAVAELKFGLEKTYSHHREESKDVSVDIIRIDVTRKLMDKVNAFLEGEEEEAVIAPPPVVTVAVGAKSRPRRKVKKATATGWSGSQRRRRKKPGVL
eukprot:gnl/Dysnectes_brevis/2651_a3208_1411.p1 GENE.gnl/Dysnectes_brevis/2651_a3208_1411~~gnl/Dysnectes_brevis/2651_a3208_1411.p1  ORF type:complete len:283 (-),score=58.89 gnl/Dysnectes_brevis/2651_a3208_1411:18-866(-)